MSASETVRNSDTMGFGALSAPASFDPFATLDRREDVGRIWLRDPASPVPFGFDGPEDADDDLGRT
jgi:hypothetical protein